VVKYEELSSNFPHWRLLSGVIEAGTTAFGFPGLKWPAVLNSPAYPWIRVEVAVLSE